MPRKYPPPARPAPSKDDQEDAFGAPEPDIELPPHPGAIREPAAPPPSSMVELGVPPEDAMAQAAWARTLLMRQAWDTAMDPSMTQSARRKEVRSILRDAARHMTDAMRHDAKKMILEQRAAIESKRRGKAAAKPERRAAGAAGAKVIPIRRDG